MTRMKRLLAASGGCAFFIFSGNLQAQGYPVKPVRWWCHMRQAARPI